ncbi:MAG: hypothetical protein ACD_9C00183G0002 [uncultured bacterium]|nr:MAG: hypothetical protein ACD_9C00183G0002 [uncultured bacterium]
MRKIKNSKAGFSLVEILVVMLIAVVAFISFYSVSTVGTKYIIESKNRLAATALVNEKMEIARNLAYEDIGIQESAEVLGNIRPEEEMTANGRTYIVRTSVRYFDDPMDGTTETSPADLIPNDYKIVRVVVSWIGSNGQEQSVSSTSRFVPPGLETSVGGSPLSINVIADDTMLPVPQATVRITNDTVSPPIDDTFLTDDNGHIILPAARISDGDHLSITKSGYETVQTMDSTAIFTPVYGHINVVSGFLNTYNYFQNKLASLTIRSADYQNNLVGSIGFSIGGGKVLGHDEFGNSVFSMANTTGTTGATSGEKEYQNINPGNYTISMEANTQYEFIDYDPSVSPFFLAPEGNATYTLRVADKNLDALFLEIKEADISQAPIAGAKVTLTDGAVDIFTEKLSSLRGVVFYPDGAILLENKAYTLKVEADGYNQDVQTINIDNLTHVEVNLTRI